MKTLLILLTAAAAMTFYAPTLSKAQIGIDVPGVGVRIGEPNRDGGVYRDRREFRGREVRGSEGVDDHLRSG